MKWSENKGASSSSSKQALHMRTDDARQVSRRCVREVQLNSKVRIANRERSLANLHQAGRGQVPGANV